MPPRLTAFASRIGLTGLAIVVLCALLAVQTIRLEGFRIWPVSVEGWKPRAERLAATIEEIREAQVVAAERARLARLEQERRYEELADNADEREAEIRRDAMAAAERFIANNRVRAETYRGAPGGTGTAAESDSAESGERPGGIAELDGVIVPAEDVRICTRNTTRLLAVREWVEGL